MSAPCGGVNPDGVRLNRYTSFCVLNKCTVLSEYVLNKCTVLSKHVLNKWNVRGAGARVRLLPARPVLGLRQRHGRQGGPARDPNPVPLNFFCCITLKPKVE